MLDIDHFKQVNDVHGHAVGDRVLTKMVSVAAGVLRQEDLIGRLGGEEFAIVLVDSGADAAAKVADRIRQAIKQVKFPGDGGPFNVTVSIGVAEPFFMEASVNDVLERADGALYQAKRTGRDPRHHRRRKHARHAERGGRTTDAKDWPARPRNAPGTNSLKAGRHRIIPGGGLAANASAR